MKVIARQLRKEDTTHSYFIRIGNAFYEMDALALRPNGVNAYCGLVSDYKWDHLKSKYKKIPLEDLPKQVLWAIIERMVNDFQDVLNHTHDIFNPGDAPQLEIKLYQYLKENDSYAVTIGNVSFRINSNDPAKSPYVPKVFWGIDKINDPEAFEKINHCQLTTNAMTTIIRQLQIYADRAVDNLQESINSLK